LGFGLHAAKRLMPGLRRAKDSRVTAISRRHSGKAQNSASGSGNSPHTRYSSNSYRAPIHRVGQSRKSALRPDMLGCDLGSFSVLLAAMLPLCRLLSARSSLLMYGGDQTIGNSCPPPPGWNYGAGSNRNMFVISLEYASIKR
jgi:hypothetical protein